MSQRRALLVEQLLEALPVHSRADAGGARRQIDLQWAGDPLEVERDAAAHRDRAAADAAAPAEGNHRDLPLGREPEGGRDLLDVGRPGNHVGRMGREACFRPEQRARPAISRHRPQVGRIAGGRQAQLREIVLQRLAARRCGGERRHAGGL